MANSSQLVFPIGTAPASRARWTVVAVYGGRNPASILEPAVVSTSLRQSTSLIARGIPARGPAVPEAIAASAASAAARASSGVVSRKAPSLSSTSAMRSNEAWVTSRAVVSPARRAAPISLIAQLTLTPALPGPGSRSRHAPVRCAARPPRRARARPGHRASRRRVRQPAPCAGSPRCRVAPAGRCTPGCRRAQWPAPPARHPAGPVGPGPPRVEVPPGSASWVQNCRDMLYARWPGQPITDDERNRVLAEMGIDPGLANRHIVRRLYPWIRGVEKGTDDGITLLIDGAVERYIDDRERREARLRRRRGQLPWMVPVAVAVTALLVLVVVPDLVFLRHA